MIVLYKGARGRGKTLTMIKDGLQYFNEGFRVLRNFNCGFGEYIDSEDILTLNKESNIQNCVMMIDEIQIFFDSRRGMSKQALTFSNFIQQSRKRGVHILCTTQYANTIDLRLRQHLDVVAYPSFKRDLGVCEVTYIDLTRMQDDMSILTNIDFKPTIVKIVYTVAPLFKLYNTSEMIV